MARCGWQPRVFTLWNLPRMLVELRVSGRPLLSHSSALCSRAQKVEAPRSAFPRVTAITPYSCFSLTDKQKKWAWLLQGGRPRGLYFHPRVHKNNGESSKAERQVSILLYSDPEMISSLWWSSFEVGDKVEAFYKGGPVQLARDGQYLFTTCENSVKAVSFSSGRVEHSLEEVRDCL